VSSQSRCSWPRSFRRTGDVPIHGRCVPCFRVLQALPFRPLTSGSGSSCKSVQGCGVAPGAGPSPEGGRRAPARRRRSTRVARAAIANTPRRRACRCRIAITELRKTVAPDSPFGPRCGQTARGPRGLCSPGQLGERGGAVRASARHGNRALDGSRDAYLFHRACRRGNGRSRRCACPSSGRNSYGIGPCARSSGTRCSAAHRADRAREAAVGHESRQAWQVPQWVGLGPVRLQCELDRSRRETATSRTRADTRLVCLPCQPSPACCASGFFHDRRRVSTNTFNSLGQRPAIQCADRFSRRFSVSW